MIHVELEWAESHFPLYAAASIHSLYSTSNMPIYKINENAASLLGIASGKGTLMMNDQTYELTEGSVIVLPAQSHVALVTSSVQPLHAYKLVIGTIEQQRSLSAGAVVRKSEIAGGLNSLFILHAPAVVSQMEELYVHRLPAHEVRHMQNQILFHQILLYLLEQMDAKYATSDKPSMERSVAYLENHFNEKITREQLAAMAGVSPSHYSTLFKQLNGFSPNEYLSRLRVHRAKELLITGSGTLREIALKVGYHDEFYLSRRFKQQTGAAPSGYSRDSLQHVAVLLLPYASHLMLLGLEPAVTITESSEFVSTANMPPPQTMRFIHAESSPEQVKSVLLDAKVELIIAAKQHLQQYGLRPEQLRAIAPVVEISWMDMGWKEHLRLIAQAVQRVSVAEQWLHTFEQEEQEARALVQQSPAAREIITILVIKPERLLIYGARNVGYVLYQSLGLRPPTRIAEEMDKLGEQFHSVPIEAAELAEYAGDRIIVIAFPDEKGSTLHAQKTFESPYWLSLPAVKQKKVHVLDKDEWVPYNPISIRLQLGRAVALFTGSQ
ncbi:AraC family transcriptional regulator [Paenibacillus sp. BIHB 4019]|uniref:AraC family transcriptional regulator n=1 Tax=Paenibacillus sp. BIHB 4019 TaxID=1870819 RepID=A0A1B2DJ57_9BACL|nr:helix-turn-helix domain-containing protein [Paenibacillus sp. BIHB 4019]ANY67770.1 AraC family transcriptional regulator [Paenibacillus sp. BIHB 4019]